MKRDEFRYRGKEAKSISESIHFINLNTSLIFDLGFDIYLGDTHRDASFQRIRFSKPLYSRIAVSTAHRNESHRYAQVEHRSFGTDEYRDREGGGRIASMPGSVHMPMNNIAMNNERLCSDFYTLTDIRVSARAEARKNVIELVTRLVTEIRSRCLPVQAIRIDKKDRTLDGTSNNYAGVCSS